MRDYPTARIAFLDVGQGDTIIVSIPDTREAVVIDCINADAVLTYLEREGIQYIRGVLVTHLHLDHYRGIVQLLKNAENELDLVCERIFFHQPKVSAGLIERVLKDDDGHSESAGSNLSQKQRKDTFAGLLRWAQAHKERYNNLTRQPGITLPLDGVIELIHPWEVDLSELLARSLNSTSAILKVHGAGSNALLTGDFEPSGWKRLDTKELKSDVLKFPHHGAWKDGDPNVLFDAVKPSIVIISVGSDGHRYGHPHQHVFKALAQRPQIRLLCTEVTKSCTVTPSEAKTKIVDLFQSNSEKSGDFFIEQKGCPCAGTVVIELGESAQVIQPGFHFHREQIIKPHFLNHQCAI